MNNIIQITEVDIRSDELFDNDPEVMFDCGFDLPDGRGVYKYQDELYLFNGEYFEKYDPVMNLLWEDKLKRINDIVENRQYAMIEGVVVDLFTASAIISVYDKINTKNKLNFLSKSIPHMASIAMRMLTKVNKNDI